MVQEMNGKFIINGEVVEKLHPSHKVINGIIVIPFIGEGRIPMWKAADEYGVGKVVWTYDAWLREKGDDFDPPHTHKHRNVRVVFA